MSISPDDVDRLLKDVVENIRRVAASSSLYKSRYIRVIPDPQSNDGDIGGYDNDNVQAKQQTIDDNRDHFPVT